MVLRLFSRTKLRTIIDRNDCAVLEKYKDNVLPLTDRDRKRIQDLLEKDLPYKDVLEYMLAHNCKLEQEAVV